MRSCGSDNAFVSPTLIRQANNYLMDEIETVLYVVILPQDFKICVENFTDFTQNIYIFFLIEMRQKIIKDY